MGLSLMTLAATSLIMSATQSSHIEFVEYEVNGEAHPAVEVIIDKGLVRELIVNCAAKGVSGIIIHTPSAIIPVYQHSPAEPEQ